MQSPGTLDPSQFTVVPHVAILDEFTMTTDDGSFLAKIDEAYLDQLIAHMNERERLTGDLSPIVIGHTTDDPQPEIQGPLLVGFARNWVKGPLGETGRQAAFADCWIYTKDADLVRRFPRRSAEVWVSRHEIDPISFLGPTTPCRDLGLLKLSRDGSLTYFKEGGIMPAPMPNATDGKLPAPASDESGKAKAGDAVQQQILQLLTEIKSALAPAGGAQAAPAAGAGTPADGELSDEEYEKLLQQMDGGEGGGAGAPMPDEKGKAGEKPVKEGSKCGYMNVSQETPGGDEMLGRMQRENSDMRARLARLEIEKQLDKLALTHTLPDLDDSFIPDLAAMPEDMRARQLDRVKKMSRPRPSGSPERLERAIADATTAPVRGKRITDQAEMSRLIKLARQKNITFPEAAAEAGYDVS